MLSSINKIIKNDEFTINMWSKFVIVNNFTAIITLESNNVVLLNKDKRIVINGNNISINKLLDNEILLSGDVTSIKIGE